MSTSPNEKENKSELVLGALAGKVDAMAEIARTEKALIQVDSGSLYFPIIRASVEVGGVFIGSGKVIVDAIVETKRGAIGKSQELIWSGSLILFSMSVEWVPPSILPVSNKDLELHQLKSKDEATEQAQQIFERNLTEASSRFDDFFVLKRHGWCVIILDREMGKIHILASKDRIVMKHPNSSLIIKGNRMVRKDGHKKLIITGQRGHILRIG